MIFESYSLLNFAILTPLVFAVVLCFFRPAQTAAIRWTAILGALLTSVLCVTIFTQFKEQDAGFQFVQKTVWVPRFDLSWHVGIDGISAVLLLMTGIVGLAAVMVSWDITKRQKEFYILLLVMISGTVGMFASLDIFFIYFFHELALIPTFLMVGIWGSGHREFAAMKMTLYLSAGAFIALIGLIALYFAPPAADRTFDVLKLVDAATRQPFSANVQHFLYPVLLFGLGTLVSLVPFHTWAPIGYASAPTATAMLHAGVLKKFGLYALIRIVLPLLPQGAQDWNWLLVVLLLCNIVYIGLVAMTQKNFNYLLGYSSVAHMGFAFLGIASLTYIGITGAVMVMFAHGLLAALLFGLSGFIFAQTKTREIPELGGLCKQMPFIGTLVVMAGFASVGLPGFANFAGEILVLFGAWKVPDWSVTVWSAKLSWPVILAIWGGSVVGAVYMLRAVRDICFGELSARCQGVTDANFMARAPYIILVGTLLWVGCKPGPIVETIEQGVRPVSEAVEKNRPKVVVPVAKTPPTPVRPKRVATPALVRPAVPAAKTPLVAKPAVAAPKNAVAPVAAKRAVPAVKTAIPPVAAKPAVTAAKALAVPVPPKTEPATPAPAVSVTLPNQMKTNSQLLKAETGK